MIVTLNGKELNNQEWFKNFNWQNFKHMDAVFTEDNDEIEDLAVCFSRIHNGQVILKSMSKTWQRRVCR